jgi:hypothetical protein
MGGGCGSWVFGVLYMVGFIHAGGGRAAERDRVAQGGGVKVGHTGGAVVGSATWLRAGESQWWVSPLPDANSNIKYSSLYYFHDADEFLNVRVRRNEHFAVAWNVDWAVHRRVVFLYMI